MPKRPPLKPGEVFAMPHPRGVWGASQVLQVSTKGVVAVVLDHVSDQRPTLDAVAARPLTCRSRVGADEVALYGVVGDLPPDYLSLGVRDAVPLDDLNPRVFAAWEALRDDAYDDQRWRQLPESAREAYQRGAASTERVTLNLPSGPRSVERRAHALHLTFGNAASTPASQHAGDAHGFDWHMLDALPCLMSITVDGDVAGFEAWLATRPMVSTVAWGSFAAETVDLRDTRLTHCELRPTGLATLRLPPSLDALTLGLDGQRPVTVEALDDGAAIELRAELSGRDDLGALRGLRAVHTLTVAGFAALDLAQVAAFERVRALTLQGAPGRLRSSDALARLRALRALYLTGCVDVDVARLPALSAFPALQEVRTWGLHERDAAALAARWGKDRRVKMKAPIDDVELFATADYPLRRWPDGQRKGMACSGYVAAAKQIMKGELTEAAGVKALRAYVTGVERAVKHFGALTAAERADVETSWARLVARAQERAPGASFAAVKRAW